jgi:hypothetical protein
MSNITAEGESMRAVIKKGTKDQLDIPPQISDGKKPRT